jgi:glycosyltransferase involved in cell wall biosynthesis
MRILWFANTPSLAEEVLSNKPTSGGWIKSLDKFLQDKVELHVAFHYHEKKDSFKHGNTTYHPIHAPFSKIDLIRNLYFRTKVFDTEFINDYKKIIENVNPDILHIHGTENSFGCISSFYKKPLLISVQGIVDLIYQKEVNTVLLGSGFSWDKIKSKMRYYDMAALERKYLPNFKYVISKSDWNTDIIRVVSPKAKVFRLNNVMRDTFYDLTWNSKQLNQDKVIISTTLSGGYLKGLDVIIAASTLLHRSGLNFEWRIAGIDKNTTSWKAILKMKNSDFPGDKIKLMGRLNEKQIADLLLDSALYATASRIENSPNNLNEALMLGMPCVASYAGGTSTFINHNEDGYLIQDGDAYAMAGGILRILDNKDNSIAMGVLARERALLRHDKNRVLSTQLEIYKSILSEKSN